MARKLLCVNVKLPDLNSLRSLRDLLELNQRSLFGNTYGNLLRLLDVKVQEGALVSLAQFYDSQMRCFTFQDFQLAPTLEEFGQILDFPVEKDNPYRYLGHYPTSANIAKLLRTGKDKLLEHRKKGTTGFFRSFFEKCALDLFNAGDLGAFMEVLALTIFGAVLFPGDREIIDLPAIDVFLAYKDRRENPTHPVLADVYYTLTYCHEKKGKRLEFCLPVLYVWLVNHMFESSFQHSCPIADFKNCRVKGDQKWASKLVNLNERTVQWYHEKRDVKEVIYQCGAFPNVPLIGTKGCINYNPSLALRQLGFPILAEPTPELITPFILYGLGIENVEGLGKVRQAWRQVIRKGANKEWGPRSCGAKVAYRVWVKNRAQEVKLPFLKYLEKVEVTPLEPPVDSEVVDQLKKELAKEKEEKRKLQEELRAIRRQNTVAEMKAKQQTALLIEKTTKLTQEETLRSKTLANLRDTTKALKKRKRELDVANSEVETVKEWFRDAKEAEKAAKEQLEELSHRFEEIETHYETQIAKIRQEREEAVNMYEEAFLKEREKVEDMLALSQERV